jgi:hypothetical protein
VLAGEVELRRVAGPDAELLGPQPPHSRLELGAANAAPGSPSRQAAPPEPPAAPGGGGGADGAAGQGIRARLREAREARRRMQRQLDAYVARMASESGEEPGPRAAGPAGAGAGQGHVEWTRAFIQQVGWRLAVGGCEGRSVVAEAAAAVAGR